MSATPSKGALARSRPPSRGRPAGRRGRQRRAGGGGKGAAGSAEEARVEPAASPGGGAAGQRTRLPGGPTSCGLRLRALLPGAAAAARGPAAGATRSEPESFKSGCAGWVPRRRAGRRAWRGGGRAGGRGRAAASACVAKGRPRPAGGSGRPAGVCRRGGPARLGWRLAPSPETKPPPVETPPRGRPGRRRSRRCGRGAQVCRRFSGAGGAPPGHAGGLGSQPPRSSAGRLVRRITLKKTRRRLSGFVFSPFALFCWVFFFSSISVSRSRVRLC